MTLYCKYSKTSPKVHFLDSLALAMADTRKYWKILLPAASSDGITVLPTSFPRRISIACRYPEEHMLETSTGAFAFPLTLSWLNSLQTPVTSLAYSAKYIRYRAMTQRLCSHFLDSACIQPPLKLHLTNHCWGWSVYLTPYLALAPG